MFAIYISDKGLLSRIKNFYKSTETKANNKVEKKIGKRFNQVHFEKGYLNDRNIYKKLLNFISHQRNAKQWSSILLHIHPDV